MAQFARPASDKTISSFLNSTGTTASLFSYIDEVSADDTDYIQSTTSPVTNIYVCSLTSVTDPVSSTGHTIRMRTSCDQDAQESLDFVQQLRQGYVSEGTAGTLIASQSRLGVTSTTWTTSAYNLTGAEADSITDYTALFLRFTVNKP